MRRLAKTVLALEEHPLARISLAVVDDAEIARLSARYLGRPAPTDVLAFPYDDACDPGRDEEIGEVIVSAETAVREARSRRRSPEAELELYVVHGLLHLLGYDDSTPAEARAMRRREIELLRKFARSHGHAGSAD